MRGRSKLERPRLWEKLPLECREIRQAWSLGRELSLYVVFCFLRFYLKPALQENF